MTVIVSNYYWFSIFISKSNFFDISWNNSCIKSSKMILRFANIGVVLWLYFVGEKFWKRFRDDPDMSQLLSSLSKFHQ